MRAGLQRAVTVRVCVELGPSPLQLKRCGLRLVDHEVGVEGPDAEARGEQVSPAVTDARVCSQAEENLFELSIHTQGCLDVVPSDDAEDLLPIFLGERGEDIGLPHRAF